jgi:hypothetical protein
VTPLRMRVMRVLALTLMVLALTANVAAADDGGFTNMVPYDPGLPSELPSPCLPSWPFTE